MSIKNYSDLKVWQKAVSLVEDVYKLSNKFPKEQIYILTAQMQRCALSVPSNIAEGRSRHSKKDFSYHLSIAKGSLAELETQIIIANKLSFMSDKEKEFLLEKTNEVGRMLHGLISKLKPET